VKTINWYD